MKCCFLSTWVPSPIPDTHGRFEWYSSCSFCSQPSSEISLPSHCGLEYSYNVLASELWVEVTCVTSVPGHLITSFRPSRVPCLSTMGTGSSPGAAPSSA